MSQIDYEYVVSSRAKLARIVVTSETVKVIVPPQFKQRELLNFIESKKAWIVQTQFSLRQKLRQSLCFAPSGMVDGEFLAYQGERLPIRLESSQLKRIQVKLGAECRIQVPADLCQVQHAAQIKKALITSLKSQTHCLAINHIQRYAAAHNLHPEGLRIKTLSSRWGSCGPRNHINLNWLLVLAPPKILEYVVVHELCHIRHKNHSRDFWTLVAELMPDYGVQRSWLKINGASLMRSFR